MTTAPSDLSLIDAFEKTRAYLLEREPSLETGALARPTDPARWKHLPAPEYQEILLAVLLGVDRTAAASRRSVRRHLQQVQQFQKVEPTDRVSEGEESRATQARLFPTEGRERWLQEHIATAAAALDLFVADRPDAPPPLIRELTACRGLREAVAHVRKRTRLLRGLRTYEFLARIGYPVVVPDLPRRRLFYRLGWLEQIPDARRFPQSFFELCERLVHLTNEPWPVIHAILGLFAGSYREAPTTGTPLAVCVTQPRCKHCVLKEQCPYHRYRGEPAPAPSRTVKRMAYAEQPRTRFETLGPANLSEVELLSLILRTGTGGKSSLDLAREILERFGGLEELARAGLGELCQIKGVGRAKAIELKAALELGRRLTGGTVPAGQPIRQSADIYAAYRGLLADEQQENFYLVVLNARNRIQRHFLISRGSLTGSIAHPREVIRPALREAAASIIFVHNHPSGEPEPSRDDIAITKRLVQAAELVGIRVLDHLIIGRDSFFSFADHGLLKS